MAIDYRLSKGAIKLAKLSVLGRRRRVNAEELAKTWTTPPCDEWEEATVLSRSLLVAIEALMIIANSKTHVTDIADEALAKIRSEGRPPFNGDIPQ